MLSPFPRENSTRTDFTLFQSESDKLLRSISSLSRQLPIPTPGPTSAYDSEILSDLTKLSSGILEELGQQASQAAMSAAKDTIPKFASDSAAAKADLTGKANSGDTSDGFILKMVFDIVPIGVNIAAKGNTIAAGLKDSGMAIVNLITNLAILTTITVIDFLEFVIQLAVYLFKLLLCSVQIILNFPKCLVFYIIDVLMFVILALIFSFLFIIDVVLMIKHFVGMSCVEVLIMVLGIIEMIDHAIYSFASFHLIHYPDKIVNLCYTCSMMGDTSGFRSVAFRLFRDIFVSVPSDVGGPIGDFFNGVGEIFSFFNI